MWTIEVTRKAAKQISNLPKRIKPAVALLIADLKMNGPICTNWPNFSKISRNKYHCHIKKGKPTYVSCWEVINKKAKLIEVYYVGTHENAPY